MLYRQGINLNKYIYFVSVFLQQSARTKQLLHETRLGSKPHTGSLKRQLAPEGTARRTKQRRVQENGTPERSMTSTISTVS